MIWLLRRTRILLLSPKSKTILIEYLIIEEETKNIIIITLIIGIVTRFTHFKELTWKEKKEQTIMRIIILIALATFITTNTLIFVTIIEITIIPLVYLVINYAKGREKINSIKYFIFINSFGSIPFIIYSLKKISIFRDMEADNLRFVQNEREWISAAFLILLLVKTPLITLHLWLSNAHVRAPGTCSIILAGILIKMGTIGIIKFRRTYHTIIKNHERWWIALRSIRVIFIRGAIIRYFDIKTIIALSSILHMSFIIILMRIQKITRNLSIVIIITGHGIVSYFLFYIITMKYEISENRRRMHNKSKESTRKIAALFIIAFIFMNIGIPPLINFMREILTCISMLVKRKIILAITITYMVVFVRLTIIFARESRYGKKQNTEKGETPSYTLTKTIFLIASSFFIIRVF